jgi:hypothetical protein
MDLGVATSQDTGRDHPVVQRELDFELDAAPPDFELPAGPQRVSISQAGPQLLAVRNLMTLN